MKNQNCYIEFEIDDYEKFNHLKKNFELLKIAKNNQEQKGEKFWLDNFPKYVIEKFYFSDTDLKPDFKTAELEEFTWYFFGLIELLERDYEIEYVSCEEIEFRKGRLEYQPYSYPYGGITGLVIFVDSFGCKPIKIDDGISLYEINFLDNGDFSITDLEDIEKQNSSNKLFNSNELLWKFVKRFKR
ncbi:hypothetical protein [Flavobacterium aestivum]|uniref:hypothetical protein n=1 Tax=Flavobacterium aestivum TaxID=3003257 RepID=UPI00228686DA|nr:hypothetical protein [Flavobacterium aestivum]